jgi:hypothetical protein
VDARAIGVADLAPLELAFKVGVLIVSSQETSVRQSQRQRQRLAETEKPPAAGAAGGSKSDSRASCPSCRSGR